MPVSALTPDRLYHRCDPESLSFDIARKIQDEMTYPGQVKITVIRETRAISYAK